MSTESGPDEHATIAMTDPTRREGERRPDRRRLDPLGSAMHKALPWSAIAPLALLLLSVYVVGYLGHSELPGQFEHPLGWWVWFDQGAYLESARAMRAGRWEPSAHFYPPGYPALGALFLEQSPVHPFFVVNATCFVLIGLLFVSIATRYVPTLVAIGAFVAGCILPGRIFEQFLIPWTTTPVALLLFVLLWMTARPRAEFAVCGAFAFLAGLIVPFRPADALATLALFAAYVWSLRRLAAQDTTGSVRFLAARIACFLGCGLAGASFFFVFNLYVHGSLLGGYVEGVQGSGFPLADFFEKFVSIWFDGDLYGERKSALLKRYPLLFFSLVGLVFVVWKGDRLLRALAAMIAIQLLIYLPYDDLLPSGLWKFHNIHYFAWFFPFLALFVVLPFVGRLRQTSLRYVAISAALVLLVSSVSIRIDAVPGARPEVDGRVIRVEFEEDTLLDGVDLRGAAGDPGALYFGREQVLLADQASFEPIRHFRVLQQDDSIRVLFIRPIRARRFEIRFGQALSHPVENAEIEPFVYRFSLGRPRWLVF